MMTDALCHRGPDDQGVELIVAGTEGRIAAALGNRRLAILDLSAFGHQPMRDAENGNWITYNGEIYNFKEIRERLEREGRRFLTQTDTEVALKAYGEWGEDCLREFRGMFAFAVWDAGRERLFLARDRMGKKPLYYARRDERLIFSSEVRSLLKCGLVPRVLSRVGLTQYLNFGSVCDPETTIEGVRALKAGHYIVWEPGKFEETQYWDIAGHEGNGESSGVSGGILDAIREKLLESVRLRLVSDVPLGVFLSGGIDSSVVTGLMSRIAPSKIETFSVVFKEQDYNEAEYSRLIARRFNTSHHEIVLTQEEARDMIPSAIAAMDQPTFDGVNTYVVSGAARRAGLKVALTGIGGDEGFAGYWTFRTVPRMERFALAWAHFPPGMRRFIATALARCLPETDRSGKLQTLMRESGIRAHPYFLSRLLFRPDQQARLLRSADRAAARQADRPLIASLCRAERYDPVNRVSYLELRHYMLNTLLRDTDCMSMAHGIEVRAPLIDHELIETLFTIRGDAKIDGGGRLKPLLVNSVPGLLPDEVTDRPKRGFVLPFKEWMKGEWRGAIEESFRALGKGQLEDFLDPEALREVWRTYLNGNTYWSRPWALYVLARWCALNL